MNKFIVCGDIHLNPSPPGIRQDDYKETIFGKLKQIDDIAQEQSVKDVVNLGDVFHTHSVNTEFIGECIDFFRGLESTWYTVVGNHDVPYGKTEYLNRSPLSLLFKSGAIKHLSQEQPKIDGIEFTAQDFTKHPEIPPPDNTKNNVLIAHQHVEAQWGDDSEVIDTDTLEQFDLSFLGHDHSHKIKTLSNGSEVVLPGSISRLTSHWKDLEKEVYICIVESDLTYEKITLDIPDIEVAFDQKELDEKDRKKELDSFIDSMDSKDVSVHAETIQEMLYELSGEKEEQDLCIEYLKKFKVL